MNGLSNVNPIKETFLLGSRFSKDKSIAILLDSVRSQEFYEITESLFKKESYDYDTFIFSSDNNAPVLVCPCAIYYYNYLEHYNGAVLSLTLRGAINAFECGAIFTHKIWHISDISEFQMAKNTIPRLFEFFDEICFINDTVKEVFFNIFPGLNRDKTRSCPIDIIMLDRDIINEKR